MSDSIHDEDDLPTLEEVRKACEYLIEPLPFGPTRSVKWTLRQMTGEVFAHGVTPSFEQAQIAVREAFKRLRDQDTAIISIAERKETR